MVLGVSPLIVNVICKQSTILRPELLGLVSLHRPDRTSVLVLIFYSSFLPGLGSGALIAPHFWGLDPALLSLNISPRAPPASASTWMNIYENTTVSLTGLTSWTKSVQNSPLAFITPHPHSHELTSGQMGSEFPVPPQMAWSGLLVAWGSSRWLLEPFWV